MRQWGKKEDSTEGGATTGEGAAKAEEDKKDKLPKRKVAALIGYNGINYKGSQVFVDFHLFCSILNPNQSLILSPYIATLVKILSKEKSSKVSSKQVLSAKTTRQITKKRFFPSSGLACSFARKLTSSIESRSHSLAPLVQMQEYTQLSTFSPSS